MGDTAPESQTFNRLFVKNKQIARLAFEGPAQLDYISPQNLPSSFREITNKMNIEREFFLRPGQSTRTRMRMLTVYLIRFGQLERRQRRSSTVQFSQSLDAFERQQFRSASPQALVNHDFSFHLFIPFHLFERSSLGIHMHLYAGNLQISNQDVLGSNHPIATYAGCKTRREPSASVKKRLSCEAVAS
jgi:hypothetical protein